MNWRRALIPILMVFAAAFGAGCAGTSQGPALTPTPTPEVTVTQSIAVPETTPPATMANCIEPSPTVTVPPALTVAVDVNRNPITVNKQITVTFEGGSGQFLTQRVDVTVIHEDCSSETKSITPPESGSIETGSSVTFNGSDRDRVQVTVTINGVPYKIIDQIYTQQTHS